MEQRYYYKTKDNCGLLNLKHKINDSNYVQITYEEFCAIQESWNEQEGEK